VWNRKARRQMAPGFFVSVADGNEPIGATICLLIAENPG